MSELSVKHSSDAADLKQVAADFGRIVHHTPSLVAKPSDAADIKAVIDFARREKLSVAARGCGHSTHGQAQVSGGVVLDMSGLGQVGEIEGDSVWVGGGASWANIVDKTTTAGFAPPTLTDYLGLSVGGTLSAGGVSGTSFHSGIQTDNVLELEVVTGAGEVVQCSSTSNRELFDAVRAGVGQCGIIARARIRVVPVPPMVTMYQFGYPDIDSIVDQHLALAKGKAFSYLDSIISVDPTGARQYVMTAMLPKDAELPKSVTGAKVMALDCPYVMFAHRLEQFVIPALKQLGVWDGPHPWLDVFIPEQHVKQFVTTADRENHTAADGFVLIYALRRSLCETPLFSMPEGTDEWFCLVDLLRNSPPDQVEAKLESNERLCELATTLGAGIYPIGSMPSANWTKLYPWSKVQAAKATFDPDGILTPGQGPVRGE